MTIDTFDFEPIPTTLQSQYSASHAIASLVESFEQKILPHDDIQLFYDKVFNLYTAEGVGLDVWGRILGIGRLIEVDGGEFFGFAGSQQKGFNQAPFYHPSATSVYRLEDEPYRRYLLIVKAFANIASAEASILNYILGQLFNGKPCYVLVTGVMTIRFVFEFWLEPLEQNILNLGLVTRGAGVGYEYYTVDPSQSFGFAGSGAQNFNNGIFDPYGVREIEQE